MTDVKEEPSAPKGLSRFLTLRVVAGIALAVVVLWGVWFVAGWFGGDTPYVAKEDSHGSFQEKSRGDLHGTEPEHPGFSEDEDFPLDDEPFPSHEMGGPAPGISSGRGGASDHGGPVDEGFPLDPGAGPGRPSVSSGRAPTHVPEEVHEPKAMGVHFVEALIGVLDYELNERFWGWRGNDLIQLTDNVENIQLGVLEVARRSSVVLTERLSRHGVSASIDKNLENAMNWLMIKPDRYWLPSSEERYNDSLKELRAYVARLEKGEARFYVRTDALIPLLLSFAELAGSCDENLVKSHEEDGSPVSWFKVDDYFYYAQGVAKAMGKILHAARVDFSSVLEARHGVDLLNSAIHACHVAADLEPWLITDAPLDGILANHRANIAAQISHLRYFLNALATALAT